MSGEGPFAAAILAGGSSARMGRDKALLVVDGRTLLERQVALAWSVGAEEVWVSGRPQPELGALRARGLPDAEPGQGPMGGLVTVLEAAAAPHVLLLAVDLPALTAGLLAPLLALRADGIGAVPRTARGWEPTAAVYPKELLGPARAALSAGRRALHALVDEAVALGMLRALPVGADAERLLQNWNTPADLERGLPGAHTPPRGA